MMDFLARYFILHWCVWHYLCSPGRYHVTDLSKGAMRTEDANKDRQRRWERWWPSLAGEIELLSRHDRGTKIIAVGEKVERFLHGHNLRPALRILHYSPAAAGYRDEAIKGKEELFTAFAGSLTWDQIKPVAIQAMTEAGMPDSLQRIRLERLRKPLTLTQKKLAFTYKVAFEDFSRGSAGQAQEPNDSSRGGS